MRLYYLFLVSLAVIIGCTPSKKACFDDATSEVAPKEFNMLPILSSSNVEIFELSKAGQAVKIQPKGVVKSYNGCMEIQRFQYISEHDQAAVLTTIRNEAANLSANTISILDYDRICRGNKWVIGMYHCQPT